MNMTKTSVVLIILLTLNIAVCASAGEKLEGPPAKMQGIVIPQLKFVTAEHKKQWEGEIKGRAVSYFRLEKDTGISNVVVSIQDNLPEYFKRIEYFDDGGDGDLDLVSMKIYEKEKGWRDVGITRDNKYGLAYADSRYKELLEQIRESGNVKK